MHSRASLTDVVKAIENSSPKCGKTRVVTIDGPAGSGKTTLANQLASEFELIQVVHLDELYDGWDDSLGPELFERIQAWILTPLENGLPPKHLLYDWGKMAFTSWKELPLTPVLILEGVGSGHTSFRKHVAQAIWIEADEHLLLDRVVQRDGETVRAEMSVWQAREKDYFQLHNVKNSAHLQLRGQ